MIFERESLFSEYKEDLIYSFKHRKYRLPWSSVGYHIFCGPRSTKFLVDRLRQSSTSENFPAKWGIFITVFLHSPGLKLIMK